MGEQTSKHVSRVAFAFLGAGLHLSHLSHFSWSSSVSRFHCRIGSWARRPGPAAPASKTHPKCVDDIDYFISYWYYRYHSQCWQTLAFPKAKSKLARTGAISLTIADRKS